ncbi:MAG TPA: hypothetical protein EYN89_10800 [Flavobacteriales bacterium]|nr:hypothetical protein [Flavobacteriales bacterium]
MNKLFKSIGLLSIFILSDMCVFSQDKDVLDTVKFEIVQGYTPTISDAFKKNDAPKVDFTPPEQPKLGYSISSNKFSSDFKVMPVQPARIKGEPLQKLYRGYVKLGGGAPGILYGEGFYNELRSRKHSWGIHAKHLSSTGNIKDYAYSGYADTKANVYGKKFLKKHTLSGGIDFDLNTVHFYGLDTGIYQLSDGQDTAKFSLNDSIIGEDNIKKSITRINGYSRLRSHFKDSSALNYDVRLKYYLLNDNYGTEENAFLLNGDFSRYIEKEFLLVQATIDYNDDKYYKEADSSISYANTIIGFYPSISTAGDKYKFIVGINGSADLGKNFNEYIVFPRVYFSYDLIMDILVPYVGIGGSIVRNSYAKLVKENPFVISDPLINNIKNSIRFYGGFKGEFSASSSFNISITRDKLENQYFFVNDTSGILHNRFNLVYDNVKLLKLSGEFSYMIRDKFKFMLLGDVYNYTTDREEMPWHTPNYNITFSGSYNLKEKIIVKLDVFALGPQWAKIYVPLETSMVMKAVKLDGIIDVNLGLEYRYTKKLSAFVQLNNLAAQQYNRWNYYPMQRFNLLGGLTYIF